MNKEKLCENLAKKGFQTQCFSTAAQAADYLCQAIQGSTVGIGGSRTIDDMGLFERLSEHNEVAWHWKQGPGETFARAAAADVYICSANAVSETGEIVNIDGSGNRLCGTLFGHKKVYIVIGTNKIQPDLEAAIHRARNVAAPLNAKRFGLSTPCAVSEEMRCYDCSSPQRICKGLLILWQKMNGVGECEVVIVDEALGF